VRTLASLEGSLRTDRRSIDLTIYIPSILLLHNRLYEQDDECSVHGPCTMCAEFEK